MPAIKSQGLGVRSQGLGDTPATTGKRFSVLRFPFYALHHHKALLLILILFTGLTLYNSIRLPLGEAPDETDHYQYHRFVARTGHPPLTDAERQEAGFKGGLAPLYYWLTAWPVALVGEATLPDVRRVDARPERFIPTDGLGINRVLHTLDEQWPWRGQPLAWHLVRLLSLPLAWVTLIATYALARRLWPADKIIAIGAVAFMAFLPRFVISSAVINDDNLVFALIALLLLVQVAILQGDRRPRTLAALGALFGLALITKYFALILIPEILLTLFIARPGKSAAQRDRRAGEQRQTTNDERRTTMYASRLTHYVSRFTFYLPFLAALLLTAAPWFLFITLRFNRIDELGWIPGLAAALGEPQITEGLVGLLSGQAVRPPAATYALPDWFGLLYRSFWFEYGWMRIFAPTWVYGLFTIFLGLALVGLIQRMLINKEIGGLGDWEIDGITTDDGRRTTDRIPRHIFILLTLHLTLFLIVVLARYILSATIDTGQGRHLYPALPVIALLISLGLHHLRFTIYDLRVVRGVAGYLLPAICFLLPAFISLVPAVFIRPHYTTLPISLTPPDELPISHRHTLPATADFFLAGLDAPPTTAAGETLPVTLYWRIEEEVNQDYLVSLCLQAETARPVACWRGHFVDGRYPGRAWEAGETLADTIHIPLPACYRLLDQPYRLHLELWPLRPDSLRPLPEASPLIRHTFSEPTIRLRPTDALATDLPQTVDVWQGKQRLTRPTAVEMNQTLTHITYAQAEESTNPEFTALTTDKRWLPIDAFETGSYLPCDDGPSPFAHIATFIADASLSPHTYQPTTAILPDLYLAHLNRSRTLAPITTTLTFSHTLAPLSLQIPNHPPLNLPISQPPNYQLPITNYQLPITLRWQAHRWMAEPLVISLKLLDKDFAIGGERIATLGDRYPNVLWTPTEIVEETYPLQIEPDTLPGLYRLELSLIRQDDDLPDGFEYLPLDHAGLDLGPNLYPLTLRLLDPAHDQPPSIPFEARLGEAIHLTGYDLQFPIPNPQSPIPVTLYWQATADIPADYTVFTQLIGPDGQAWAQWDNPPQAGRYPTSLWVAGDQVVDRYDLLLRENYPPGEYRLLVGMYDPTTGERLPVTINGQPQPNQAVELTKLKIMP